MIVLTTAACGSTCRKQSEHTVLLHHRKSHIPILFETSRDVESQCDGVIQHIEHLMRAEDLSVSCIYRLYHASYITSKNLSYLI